MGWQATLERRQFVGIKPTAGRYANICIMGSQALLTGLYKAAAKVTLPHNKNLRDNIIVENFGHALPDFDFDNKPR
ncbi:hypothetical protein [Psychrobacter sp. WY6]|uniref:hypothetical protein n=1 Tax=Psychrobacter sp. WY6 TaxID=2708350 RepID=UPI002023013A|nr:hypothetical protein [Psychrobacter sp. WY6]